MAAEALTVILEGRPIGDLVRMGSGALRLRFDEAYRADPEATLLSVSMPPGDESHGDGRVTPWLWGLLPDNGDVLARWGRRFGVSVASPFPLLGTQVGHDCAGAVQFCPPDDVDRLLAQPGDVAWLTEAEMAVRIRTLRADSTSWLGPGFTGQFSLGGAQAKTALYHADGRWGVAMGSAPTTHILKPAMPGLKDQHLNEHLCLAAARGLGLPAAVTRMEAFEDETAIVVERFDRSTGDGSIIWVHQEDLCQALSVPPARKYQADGGPSAGRIVELLRANIPGSDAETDVWRFVDALAFNWLIAGTDAHAKNFGLLLAGTQIRLAPLYDVASYLPYDDSGGRKLRLAMKVGDDYLLRRTDRRSAWAHAAQQLKLDTGRLIGRVVDLANRMPDAFARVVEDPSNAELTARSEMAHRLVDLVTDRCRRCSALLG